MVHGVNPHVDIAIISHPRENGKRKKRPHQKNRVNGIVTKIAVFNAPNVTKIVRPSDNFLLGVGM